MVETANIIALLTDFGLRDHYVGVMKGVILSINPHVRIVDVSHDIQPQDIISGYLHIRNTYTYFPKGAIFVVVVDPEVGTDQKILCVQTKDNLFLAPDNGLLGFLDTRGEVERIYHVKNRELFLQPVSTTFHGRDVFAPVAAHLSLGIDPSELGPELESMTRFSPKAPKVSREGIVVGEILVIDGFGNLVTNIPTETLLDATDLVVRLGKYTIKGLQKAYADEDVGALLALTGSSGTLEIAINEGNAAVTTRARVGDIVRVTRTES